MLGVVLEGGIKSNYLIYYKAIKNSGPDTESRPDKRPGPGPDFLDLDPIHFSNRTQL